MRIFVTAGNTQAPIDRVRCITNIFTGRTGAAIALEAYRRGHHVTLATSHPETIDALDPDPIRWRCLPYRTFDDLAAIMAQNIADISQDAVIHCAAVSDFLSAGIFAPVATTRFDAGAWEDTAGAPRMADRSAPKVKSDEPELWLRLVRAPKLVNKIRTEWKYSGLLLKFKLEVGVSPEALQTIAEKSRLISHADWMVANTLDGASSWALIGNANGYTRVVRADLASAILDVVEKGFPHG
jgi:phosphopantothenoylcysteine synthetase/decarboxylase